MKATIRIQEVFSTILEETKQKLVVMKEGKTFIGPLFFMQTEVETLNNDRRILVTLVVS